MAIEAIHEFIGGATLITVAYFRDEDSVLVNPINGASLTIVDSEGTERLDAQSMTNISTGLYKYYYTLPANPPEGTWKGEVIATDGIVISKDKFNFEVVKEL